MIELRTPCPACGQMPDIESRNGNTLVRVACMNHECSSDCISFSSDTKERAISAWETTFGQKQPTGGTIKVRAACAIANNGEFVVEGWSNAKDKKMAREARDILYETGRVNNEDVIVHFVNVDVSIQQRQEIDGVVENE